MNGTQPIAGDLMPNDNAFLPPTIHLGYVSDDFLISHLNRARESIRFIGPGLSLHVVKVLTERWYDLGARAVDVVIDSDADVCRLGFGDGEAVELLFKTANALNAEVHRLPGIRLCVLEIDGERIIYSPTPRLVERGDAAASEIILAPSADAPDESSVRCIFDQILAPPEVIQEVLTEAEVQRTTQDLKQSPPLPFDLARQVRVLSTEFQFVEFSLLRAALSRKRVPVPPDLLGLAKDTDTEELLRANFQLVGKDEEASGEKLMKRRDQIDKEFLCTIALYGKVIMKGNRADFDKAVEALKTEVCEFRKEALENLKSAIDRNCKEVVERLYPNVEKNVPKRWKATLGPNPSEDQIKRRLREELQRAYGEAEKHLDHIEVRLVYKNVTVEMLRDPDFRAAAAKARLDLDRMCEEYDAARTRGALVPSSR